MFRRLTWLLVALAYLALSGLALWLLARAPADSGFTHWLASSVASCTLLLFALLVLAAACSRRERRASCAGGALVMALYWLTVFSSWLGPSVGGKLLSTRALAALEQRLRPADASMTASTVAFRPRPVLSAEAYVSAVNSMLDDYFTALADLQNTATPRLMFFPSIGPVIGAHWPSSVATALSPFQETGHYLLLWPLTLLAMWLAAFLYRRGRGREALAPAAPAHAMPPPYA